jgi:hypothetical protein
MVATRGAGGGGEVVVTTDVTVRVTGTGAQPAIKLVPAKKAQPANAKKPGLKFVILASRARNPRSEKAARMKY